MGRNVSWVIVRSFIESKKTAAHLYLIHCIFLHITFCLFRSWVMQRSYRVTNVETPIQIEA